MEREVGGGIGMGKTCKLKDVSFQCMTKFTTNKKKKKKKYKKKKKTKVKSQLNFLINPSINSKDISYRSILFYMNME